MKWGFDVEGVCILEVIRKRWKTCSGECESQRKYQRLGTQIKRV
jgi:hypothetical protein